MLKKPAESNKRNDVAERTGKRAYSNMKNDTFGNKEEEAEDLTERAPVTPPTQVVDSPDMEVSSGGR